MMLKSCCSYCSNDNNQVSGQVEPVIIIGSKGGITFWTLPLSSFVSRPQTVETENMETFGQNGIFSGDFARRTGQGAYPAIGDARDRPARQRHSGAPRGQLAADPAGLRTRTRRSGRCVKTAGEGHSVAWFRDASDLDAA